ncbi:MAG: single-stranded DNA-binding protein [Desulfobacteraceae bacterium]|nr:single-stranded DNA-binding protein [Desulfobacteraceae bacterium]
MAGVNKAIIIGNLGRDPEVSYTQGGVAVCRMAVATSEEWTDKGSGQKQERTEWHRVVVFNKQAENCGRYLHKGSKVYVEGKLRTSQYEKDGQTHYSTEILASSVQFLSSGQGGGQAQGGGAQKGYGGYQGQGGGSSNPDDIPF